MPEESESTTPGDEQLIAAALSGETSSFGAIVERYWNMAVALALTKINDPIEAEDAAQESFIKAYSQLHALRDPSRFAGWLAKIVAQQCTNVLRQKVRDKRVGTSRETFDPEALGSVASLNTNPGLTAEQAHFVRRTVSRLPKGFRKVVIMRFVGGL
ncbi:MAG: RNA polymerase sigma factor [Planctomycetota bacterium]|jgi:RNA polymerase sigma-70 factor (ECF subfamily)